MWVYRSLVDTEDFLRLEWQPVYASIADDVIGRETINRTVQFILSRPNFFFLGHFHCVL